MRAYMKFHEADNVAIALIDLQPGQEIIIDESKIVIRDEIKKGHKIALVEIEPKQDVIKYGHPIGHATTKIEAGSHIHTHNIKTNLDESSTYDYEPKLQEKASLLMDREVHVYHRKNWDVGIRNELWIVPTVGSVNKMAESMKEIFLKQHPKLLIDGVFAFTHPHGYSQVGENHEATKKILQNIVKHPNAGGVLVLGLGCENNQIEEFKASLGEYDEERVRFLVTQDVEDEMEVGANLLDELYKKMQNDYRSTSLLRNLRIGLKCGGSDGLSGLTGNPLLGHLSDYIVKSGGTTVLTEVSKVFGSEKVLMNRALNQEIFEKAAHVISGFKAYYGRNNQNCYEALSQGNMSAGISTLEDKALGCIQKAGTSNLVDVIGYSEQIKKSGFNLLEGPSDDMIAVTNLGSAGCHLALFTTNRGTPFGGFIPTVKIATNSELARRKSNWIDYNAEQLLLTSTMEEVVEDFINYICDVCSGKWTKNEFNGYREIAIWNAGVTL